eukprot:350155-Chlamydomonas_euryale.AAC.1
MTTRATIPPCATKTPHHAPTTPPPSQHAQDELDVLRAEASASSGGTPRRSQNVVLGNVGEMMMAQQAELAALRSAAAAAEASDDASVPESRGTALQPDHSWRSLVAAGRSATVSRSNRMSAGSVFVADRPSPLGRPPSVSAGGGFVTDQPSPLGASLRVSVGGGCVTDQPSPLRSLPSHDMDAFARAAAVAAAAEFEVDEAEEVAALQSQLHALREVHEQQAAELEVWTRRGVELGRVCGGA